MLKLFAPKFHPDLSVRLRDIAEKQAPVKLKPIVGVRDNGIGSLKTHSEN